MKTISIFLSSICMLLFMSVSCQAEGWRGIIPLRSTRADVERILGVGTDRCNCHYETTSELIYIDYAQAPCMGSPLNYLRGWNVPADTVLRVRSICKSK
jgi:hypothetical protein